MSVAAIYARVSGKDALLLAAYDEVHRRIDEGRAEGDALELEPVMSPAEAVNQAVASVVDVFLANATFMRSVILLSGSHPEIRRRGSEWTTQIGRDFAAVLSAHSRWFDLDDIQAEVDLCYRVVFSSAAMHVAYGSQFASERQLTDKQLVAGLQAAARRTLKVTEGAPLD